MTHETIKLYGRHIVDHLKTHKDIPYLDQNKCQIFSITITIPQFAIPINHNPKENLLQYSHVILNWYAKPKENSSIIWSNLKRIKTHELNSLIEAIKRDIKIELLLL